MTREEAVLQLQSEGFHAFKRDWKMGETIGVGILKPNEGGDECERFVKLIYIFPIKTEWGIHAPELFISTDYSRHCSLEEACNVARRLLRCEFLPFRPEDLRFHQVRTGGGECQTLEHMPTGIIKQLTGPTATGGEVVRKKREALDELAFDLALNRIKTSGNE